MPTIGANYKVGMVPDECVTYLALALRARLQDLVTGMIHAAGYRTHGGRWDRALGVYEGGGPADGEGEEWTEPGAAWGILVRSDVAKQLAALGKVERTEEERERERRERCEWATTAVLMAVLNGKDPPPQIPRDDNDMDLDPPEWPPRKRAVSDEAERRMAVNAAVNRAWAASTRGWLWGLAPNSNTSLVVSVSRQMQPRLQSHAHTILAPRLWYLPTRVQTRGCASRCGMRCLWLRRKGAWWGAGGLRGGGLE
ncbi:hypothetical protein B0H14DRAFT_3641064 [Mycena olivaceomarginata]|nr:hypothetical protein B0H14DRAFT_3641064 [Mycena olivaceomarginata]